MRSQREKLYERLGMILARELEDDTLAELHDIREALGLRSVQAVRNIMLRGLGKLYYRIAEKNGISLDGVWPERM